MVTELKPVMSCVYLARKSDTNELIGWDAVDAFTISKHQKMMNEDNVTVFYLSLRSSGTWYQWTEGRPDDPFSMGFYPVANELLDKYIPKELRMQILTGAI